MLVDELPTPASEGDGKGYIVAEITEWTLHGFGLLNESVQDASFETFIFFLLPSMIPGQEPAPLNGESQASFKGSFDCKRCNSAVRSTCQTRRFCDCKIK